jgi:hypothetical protein
MEEVTPPTAGQVSSGMDKRLLYGAVAVVIAAILLGGFLWIRSGSADPDAVSRKEAQELVATVSKLIVLPDEEPVIATVADPSQLIEQPFFANAKKGDKVLIFNVAKKAVLYSPSENRIIEVAPLSIGE